MLEGFEHELCAPNRHIGIWAGGSIGGVADLGRGRTRWYVGRRIPAGIGWGTADERELLDHAAGWYAPVREAVAAADLDSITTMESWELAPLARWIDRRLVLLGDSAHPTRPSVSGGACTAIVDAVSLARHLTSGAPVDDALAAYQAERKKRDEHIVKRSRWVGRLQHMHTPIGFWLRDHAMEQVPAGKARRVAEKMASGAEEAARRAAGSSRSE